MKHVSSASDILGRTSLDSQSVTASLLSSSMGSSNLHVTSSLHVTILKHSFVNMLVCVSKTHLILLSKLFRTVYNRSVNLGLFIR